MASQEPTEEPQQAPAKTEEQASGAELEAALEDLVNTISNKFAGISSEMFAKMDEMSRRIDKLEATLMAEKDKENPPKPS